MKTNKNKIPNISASSERRKQHVYRAAMNYIGADGSQLTDIQKYKRQNFLCGVKWADRHPKLETILDVLRKANSLLVLERTGQITIPAGQEYTYELAKLIYQEMF